MLQRLRDRTQSLGFKIVIGVLVFALAFFGFGAFNVFAPGDPELASVNGEEITRGMVEVEAERQRRRLMLQLGDELDPETIDPLALQRSAMDQLITRTLFNQAVDDLGLEATQTLIDDTVASDPNFQVDGAFNENLYRRGVAALGYSAPEYLREIGTLLRVNQLREVVAVTAVLPLWELRLLNGLMNQQRDIAYLPFTVERFSEGVAIAEEELETHYAEHQAAFMTEEAVDIAYLEMTWRMFLDDPTIEVDAATLLREYEADKENAGSDEQRDSSHILLRVTDERNDDQAVELLNDLRGRIDAGESFADLASEYSEDPGSATNGGALGSVGKGIFDPEFESALWALEEDGQLSEPVKSQFGYHLIRLDGVEINPYPSFDEQRAGIEERLRETAARELFKERLREFDNLAFEMSDSLDGIAEELGLEQRILADVTRDAGEGIFVNADLRAALFAPDVLEDGNNSPAVEYSDGRAVVARVRERHMAAVKAYAEVRGEIEALLIEQAARQALLTARSDALQQIRDGVGVSEVADANGLAWETFELVSRGVNVVPDGVLEAAFALPRPQDGGRSVGEASLGDEGEALVTVTRVESGDLAALSDTDLDAIRDYFASRGGTLDFGALQIALEARADIDRPAI